MEDLLVDLMLKLIEAFRIHSVQNNIYFARKNNLSMSQMGALFHLYRADICSVSEIAEKMGISTAAVSQMLERLVQQGLIQRTEALNDRRSKTITLTENGRRMVSLILCASQQWVARLVGDLTPDEREKTQYVMNLLVDKATLLNGNANTNEMKESHICCG